jgi:hypothetical protein
MRNLILAEGTIEQVREHRGITCFQIDGREFLAPAGAPLLADGNRVRVLAEASNELWYLDNPAAADVLALQQLPPARIYYKGIAPSIALTLVGAVETALTLNGIPWLSIAAALIALVQVRCAVDKDRVMARFRELMPSSARDDEPRL